MWDAEGWNENGIDLSTNSSFRTALTPPPPRDPLALDLDGNGIETAGIGAAPVVFDHDADGIKTGTGWVRGDDAWLVLDRNANGRIDSGQELFGVDTVLTNADGSTRRATDGFDALRSLDANGDNLFDASDAAYSQVRLWQDLNQDGLSQSNELSGLAERGIASIGLGASAGTTNLGNGNTVTGRATVTRTDGSTTQSGVVNLDLATNAFHREFTEAVPLSETARGLPEMRGSGVVRDLREAMSLGSPQAQALASAVQTFASGTTRIEQQAALDDLLHAWAATETIADRFGIETPGSETRRFTVNGSTDAALQSRLNRVIPVLEVFNGITVDASGWASTTSTVGGQTVRTYTMASQQATSMLASHEALRQSVYASLVVQTRLQPYLDSIELVIDGAGVSFDTSGLAALLDAAGASDQNKAIVDLAELVRFSGSTLGAVGFDGVGKLKVWVEALPAGSPVWTQLAVIDVLTSTSTAGSARADIYFGNGSGNSFSAGAGDDIVDGGAGSDSLQGGDGDDWLQGGAGADSLSGEAGNDTLEGGADADTLIGGEGDDILVGGTGNDSLNDYSASSNDTYRFTRGDAQDSLSDYGGSDRIELGGLVEADVAFVRSNASSLTIDFGGGGGIRVNNQFNGSTGATLSNYAVESLVFADGTSWNIDRLKAEALRSTALGDTIVGFETDDLIDGGDGSDSLRGMAGNDTLIGGAGHETLQGGDGADVLRGDAGADYLAGDGGDDLLKGGADGDTLVGGEGNDVLAGGTGNDSLNDYSASSNEIYRFARGDGQDNLSDYGGSDRIELAGLVEADVAFVRSNGSSLTVDFGGGDRLVVNNQFNGSTGATLSKYVVESLVFADGTSWDIDRLKAEALRSTALGDAIVGFETDDLLDGGDGSDILRGLGGNDTLLGGAGHETLQGGDGADVLKGDAGADYLSGDAGDDRLEGGADGDTLSGGEGNDTYVGGAGNDSLNDYSASSNDIYRFARGDGQDTIIDLGGSDRIELGSLVEADVAYVRSSGSSLVVGFGGGDSLTVNSVFNGSTGATLSKYVVENLVFADGTSWGIDRLKAEALRSTALGDTIVGFETDDSFEGGDGNDTLRGLAGNDSLKGGGGSDSLQGGDGADGLQGGAGADYLYGDAGDDRLEGGAESDYLTGVRATTPTLAAPAVTP